MPRKSTSKTVTIIRKKRHKVPAYWRGTTQRTHDWRSPYGNGSDGSLRKPADQPIRNQQ
jgi:hypothetical protein